MYFSSPEELKKIVPINNGVWNKEYLVWDCKVRFEKYIDGFFQEYLANADLEDLLFGFLPDD